MVGFYDTASTPNWPVASLGDVSIDLEPMPKTRWRRKEKLPSRQILQTTNVRLNQYKNEDDSPSPDVGRSYWSRSLARQRKASGWTGKTRAKDSLFLPPTPTGRCQWTKRFISCKRMKQLPVPSEAGDSFVLPLFGGRN